MSKFNFDKQKVLREEGETPVAVSTPSTFVPGGAYYSSPSGTVGGVYAPFQTAYNTVGIGNPVFGGSDRFDNVVGSKPKKKKVTKK